MSKHKKVAWDTPAAEEWISGPSSHVIGAAGELVYALHLLRNQRLNLKAPARFSHVEYTPKIAPQDFVLFNGADKPLTVDVKTTIGDAIWHIPALGYDRERNALVPRGIARPALKDLPKPSIIREFVPAKRYKWYGADIYVLIFLHEQHGFFSAPLAFAVRREEVLAGIHDGRYKIIEHYDESGLTGLSYVLHGTKIEVEATKQLHGGCSVPLKEAKTLQETSTGYCAELNNLLAQAKEAVE